MARKRRMSKANKRIIAVSVIVLIILVALTCVLRKVGVINPRVAPAAPAPRDRTPGAIDGPTVGIYFVDVGQGDGIIIKFPDSSTMLIDAGSASSDKKAKKAKYLKTLSELDPDGTIEHLAVTHPDSDHYDFMGEVIDRYSIENFYFNEYEGENSKTYNSKFVSRARSEPGASLDRVISSPDDSTFALSVGGCSLTFFSPGNDGFSRATSGIKNGMSLIVLLEYGGRRALFTGDATEAEESWFVGRVRSDPALSASDFDTDFLKSPHHGADTSSSEAFLDLVKPEHAVISAGKNNKYGHPKQSTLDRYATRGIDVRRTDVDGTILLEIDSDGDYRFACEND